MLSPITSGFALLAFTLPPVGNALRFVDVTPQRIVATVPEDPTTNMKEVEAGDFDRDGDLDVAVAVAGGTYGARRNKLYRNDAGVLVEISGTSAIPPFANADVSRHAAFRDLNGDGWLDLVIVNDAFEFNDPIRVFRNHHPHGVFQAFLDDFPSSNVMRGWSCGAVSADLDADGDVDIFEVNYGGVQGQDHLYSNDGSASFAWIWGTHLPVDTDFSVDAAAADVNGDGRIDVIVSNSDVSCFVKYNNLGGQGSGSGDFSYGAGDLAGVQDLGSSSGAPAIEPGDFDGDGRVDLYWTNRVEHTGDRILRNTGNGPDGKAQFVEVLPPAFVRAVPSVKASVADLDGDGRLDVVVATATRPAILRNTTVNGQISFVDWTPADAFPSGNVLAGAHAALFDADGDGDVDMLLGGNHGEHLFETRATATVDESALAGGVLPAFFGGAPLAIAGSATPGATDTFSAGASSAGTLAAVLRGTGDFRLEVRRAGVVVASSDRGGAGVEEALELVLAPGAHEVRVIALATGGGYVLELLARTDGPANDACANALVVPLGATTFSNVSATTDGPAHPVSCFLFNDDQVRADVWFDHLATCTGQLTASTCGTADFDTRIAVYQGEACPVDEARFLGCAEDTVGCAGYTSSLTVNVVAGQWYKIRVGGWMGAQGSGTLALSCVGSAPPASYCSTSPNSVGPGATMAWAGSASVAANDLVLAAFGCPPNTTGLFVRGTSATQAPFGNGFRCVAGFVVRLGALTTNLFGDATRAFDGTHAPAVVAGQTWHFQFWYRNPAAGGSGFNLSDGLRVVFGP